MRGPASLVQSLIVHLLPLMCVAYEAVWELRDMRARSIEHSCFDTHRSDKIVCLLRNHNAQPRIQLVKWSLVSGVKRPGRNPHHSPLGSAEIKNGCATRLLCTCAFMEGTRTSIPLPLPNSVPCCALTSRGKKNNFLNLFVSGTEFCVFLQIMLGKCDVT